MSGAGGDAASTGKRGSGRWLVAGTALVVVVVVVGAIVVAATRTDSDPGGTALRPRALFTSAVVTPSGPAGAPAATDPATASRVSNPQQPELAALGFADSLDPKWPMCVPGTVLGYQVGRFLLYPQYEYHGMKAGTKVAFTFSVQHGTDWKKVTTTPALTWAATYPADGCSTFTIPFDEADPLGAGKYLVEPVLNGTTVGSAGQKLVMDDTTSDAAAARLHRHTCVDLPPYTWPGGEATNTVALGRASVGLDDATLNGQIVFLPGLAALTSEIGGGYYTDLATADQAARQKADPNAYGSHYLRYVVVQNGDKFYAFTADMYLAFVTTGTSPEGIPKHEANPSPPPCKLSDSQATVLAWHATYPTYSEGNGPLRTIAYDWYAGRGGSFTFPNG